MSKKVLLGLTTITPGEWRKKIKEIDELGIKEIALFPTCLNFKERHELYQLLEKTKLEKIPHVHLRSDMEVFELDYLVARFKTEVFNVHSEKSTHPYEYDCESHRKSIYVENMEIVAPTENDLKKYAGLCIDLSHWESGILSYGEENPGNKRMANLVNLHKIGVNHVSAVKSKAIARSNKSSDLRLYHFDSHWLDDLKELDYLKKYNDYLADIISIELENPLKRQQEARIYLEKILLLN